LGAAVLVSLAVLRSSAGIADSLLSLRSDPLAATTSSTARQSALRSIPFDRLHADAKQKVSSVLSHVTFFRRLPTQVIQCDPDLYLFLVEHPDVVVNIWQLMGVSQVAVEQSGQGTFRVADVAGTKGSIEYLYSSHDTHVIHTEGFYDGPLFARQVRGRGLMILKTGYVREPDGRFYITCRLDTFMRVEHFGAELLTKVFQPLVGKVADKNFTQTAGFIGSLSRTAEADHQGIVRLASRLAKVPPEVRHEFAELAEQAARKAVQPETAGEAFKPEVAGLPSGESLE
jgi:hypothetical protein